MLTINKKIKLLFVLLGFAYQSTAMASQQEDVYRNFITSLGNNIITILVDKKAPLSKRKEEFRQVLRDYFDIPEIGKFVLARYWKRATTDQQSEYLKLFENAIVDNYAAQFDDYHNETLEVQSVRESANDGIMVMSLIKKQTGTPPLKVDWKIFQTKRGLRVYDIIINGVSMSITQRSEYAGIINKNGGIEGLLNLMREGKSPTFKAGEN